MKRLFIQPSAYNVYSFQKGENPYITDTRVDEHKAKRQYTAMIEKFQHPLVFRVNTEDTNSLSDIVFSASAGISLPRLPHPLVILPSMKYPHRQGELGYLRTIFQSLKIHTVDFPQDAHAPFEGQAEMKWFHGGKKAICGYGFRATKKTFAHMKTLLHDIYPSYGLAPPELLVVHLKSDRFYHFDLAMLEFDTTSCIVHKDAFSSKTLQDIVEFLGKDHVHVIDTEDKFCLNAVVDGPNLITHKLKDRDVKKVLETLTKKKVVETNVSQFELSGGSVRCMSMDIF